MILGNYKISLLLVEREVGVSVLHRTCKSNNILINMQNKNHLIFICLLS